MTSAPDGDGPNRGSLLKRTVLAGLALLVLLELSSSLGILAYNRFASEPIRSRSWLMQKHLDGLRTLIDAEGRREVLHPVYGWSYRPSYAEGPDTLNESGLRASRPYGPARRGVPRVAAFGDSFVYCNEVPNPDCWTSQLEQGWHVEVLNYGVGGYGTDQAFLRYLAEGRELEPQIVLIGFAPVNLRRIVNRYRGFLSQSEGPWFKPRFIHEGDSLRLIPAPITDSSDARRLLDDPTRLEDIGRNDQWYEESIYEQPLYRWSATYRLFAHAWIQIRRRVLDENRLLDSRGSFRPQSEAFRLELAVLQMFVDSVSASGASPTVLMLPSQSDVNRYDDDEVVTYAILADSLRMRSIQVIDPIAALASAPPTDSLFASGGHYSPRGNSLVARSVAEALGLERR